MAVDFRFFMFAAQHTQHGLCRPFAQWSHFGKKAAPIELRQLVQRFDHHREANCSVQIAFWNMVAEALGDQAKADHQQEAQAQDNDCRVGVDEAC
ncbi:hypothetical protein D3C80_1139860 [compost metagenome]